MTREPDESVRCAPVDIPRVCVVLLCVAKGHTSASRKMDVLQGTLDFMVLQTLQSMGPLHGYGIARRIEQVSDDLLKLNEGTVYASLTRLQHQRWISASWGASENNRKAKFYAITKAGRRQLACEKENWGRMADVIARLLRLSGQLLTCGPTCFGSFHGWATRGRAGVSTTRHGVSSIRILICWWTVTQDWA